MSTDNLDIEQMRKAWMEMGKALGMQNLPGGDPKVLGKKKTALDRLRDKYHTFGMVSLVMVIGGFLIFSRGMDLSGGLNLWLGLSYAAYFLTVSCMDFCLWRGLGTIDPLRMDISEIARKSMFYRKRHLQFMAIVIPMAIAVLGFTGYVYSSETYFLSGMIVGIILGSIIGIIQFHRFMAEYRKLSD